MQAVKRALVTGGNRGIGFAIAQGLVARGYQVIITARSRVKAEQAAQALQGSVIPLEMDVSCDLSIQQALATVPQTPPSLDVLINNAGINPTDGDNILTAPRENLAAAMTTNAFGVIQMVQQCLPLLEMSSDARVINVSSGAGTLEELVTTMPSYSLSKLALNGATLMLARILQAKGIAVNAMCPGWVRTDMGGTEAPRTPEQGADTAIWLATEVDHSETGKFWRDRAEISF